jgi:hypothetical protein
MRSVVVEIPWPRNRKRIGMPKALQERLQTLLDRQDRTGRLAPQERREALALVELNDFFSLMRPSVTRPRNRKPA